MQYQRRSTADKSAVKCAYAHFCRDHAELWLELPLVGVRSVKPGRYTGFLPLEGVYEEDTCRVDLTAVTLVFVRHLRSCAS